MLSLTDSVSRFTSVVVQPGSRAAARYPTAREDAARAPGFPARPSLNLHDFGGRTIAHLTFTNAYLGGPAAWSTEDVTRIDHALAAAMEDPHLNNVLAQYYPGGGCTSTFAPSRVLDRPAPARVFRDTIEELVAELDAANGLSGLDLATSVICLLLPKGVVLVDGTSTENPGGADSEHGLGGYHGSIHPGRGTGTVYYAVGVYSEGGNGIVAFDEPWKNVCATFYHELCEARTDPDVEDAIRAGSDPKADRFLGWYSPQGGEIGDIPIEEAGPDLSAVLKEVPLADGSGTVPIQLQWSNAVGGPEGPIASPHQLR